jgi:hypothetical protein
VVIGATPEFHYSVPQCLLRRPLRACSMPRAAVDARRGRSMNIVATTVVSNDVMFFDPQHMTTAGSQLLAPKLTGDLRWLLHDVAAGNNVASREGSIPNI